MNMNDVAGRKVVSGGNDVHGSAWIVFEDQTSLRFKYIGHETDAVVITMFDACGVEVDSKGEPEILPRLPYHVFVPQKST
jgi:hypothetical protein